MPKTREHYTLGWWICERSYDDSFSLSLIEVNLSGRSPAYTVVQCMDTIKGDKIQSYSINPKNFYYSRAEAELVLNLSGKTYDVVLLPEEF